MVTEISQWTNILINYKSPQGGAGKLACWMAMSAFKCKSDIFLNWYDGLGRQLICIWPFKLHCQRIKCILLSFNFQHLASLALKFRVSFKRITSSMVGVSTQSMSDTRYPVHAGQMPIWKLYLSIILMLKETIHWKVLFPKHWKSIESNFYLTFIGNWDLIL